MHENAVEGRIGAIKFVELATLNSVISISKNARTMQLLGEIFSISSHFKSNEILIDLLY